MARRSRPATQTPEALHRLLSVLVTRYVDAVAFEERRWGEASAARLAEKGIDPPPAVGDELGYGPMMLARALHKLQDAGLITVSSRVSEHVDFRRGDYGRWIGGSVTRTAMSWLVRPTEAGLRAVLEE